MSQTYKIKAVKPGFRDWSNDFGTFHSYAIQVEGNGEPVNINRKSNSPAPKVGEEIYGDINDSEYGQQFKSQRKPQDSNTGGNVSREGSSTEDNITRAVALKAAAVVFQSNPPTKPQDVDTIMGLADDFYAWLTKQPDSTVVSADKSTSEPTPEMPEGWLVEDDNE